MNDNAEVPSLAASVAWASPAAVDAGAAGRIAPGAAPAIGASSVKEKGGAPLAG